MKNIFLKLTMILMMLPIISCQNDDEVGKWPKMKWEYENITDGISVVKNKSTFHEINVSKSGSIDIVCTNYTGMWFADLRVATEVNGLPLELNGTYYKMTIEGNTLHCEFTDISTTQPEDLMVTVTAGDIFDYFHFNISAD